ncbi:LamG domain-containing protein [Candidatus Poribacteria bacterium]|nr:LamG domain-containing protein [Candidatus Poribacteria bacterium]
MRISLICIKVLIFFILLGLSFYAKGKNLEMDDLVVYYSFDADTLTDTDYLDLSGNENHGLIQGNNIISVDGQVKEAVEFPGLGGQYIAVRNVEYVAGIPELSISVWIKTGQKGLISSWDRSEFFRFGVGDDQLGNETLVAFDVCCPITDWHGETEVTDDKWHHIVVTFDGEKKRIFVDGKLDAEEAAHGEFIGPKAVRFGFIGVGSEAPNFNGPRGPTNFPFKGLMDEYIMLHRALTEKEVQKIADLNGNPFDVESVDKLTTVWGDIKKSR